MKPGNQKIPALGAGVRDSVVPVAGAGGGNMSSCCARLSPELRKWPAFADVGGGFKKISLNPPYQPKAGLIGILIYVVYT